MYIRLKGRLTWRLTLFTIATLLIALTMITTGPARRAFAEDCSGLAGGRWWPSIAELKTSHQPGSTSYSATFQFRLTDDQLRELRCQANYLEIDFELHGFLAQAEWDDYEETDNIPGGIHDTAESDNNLLLPRPAVTAIRTNELQPNTSYWATVSWSTAMTGPIQERHGEQQSVSIDWIPSHWANTAEQVAFCAARALRPAWCIFAGEAINYGSELTGLPDGRLVFDGDRRQTIITANGSWVSPTPQNGATILTPGGTLPINVQAQDMTGTGLKKIEITWFVPGKDTSWSSRPRHFLLTLGRDTYGSFRYDIPVNLGTSNEMIVSFDIYTNDGSVREAPHGMRRYCRVGTSCSPISNPPTGGAPPPSGGGGMPPGSGAACVPGQYQAAVFMDANFQGSCVVKGIGDYADPAAIGLTNDSISSIKVGSGANVRLCDNAGLNSPCEYFGADDPDLSNNMINTNTVSSMKVEGGGPTTNCVPAESEVAFFMGENYQETCIIRGVGRYDDPAALGLPNDTISSVKIGSRVRVRICANDGNNSPCDQFENNIPNLGPTTVQNNTASSAEITSRGGIALCDGNNGSGDCRYYGAGATGISYYNMSDQGFDNRTRSVRYDSDWAGLYHIVLYVDQNQTGALYHADNSVGDLGTPYSGNISSIQVYRHQPPTARIETPLNGAMFPTTATSVNLVYNGGNQKRVHVWANTGYDFDSGWRPEDSYLLTNLVPGTYSWQVQGRNQIGDGPWSPVQTFTINTPPTVASGELTMNAGTSQTIQIQAYDADQNPVTLSAANLPSFASFTDNTGGIGTLTLNPGATAAGQYAITITASDGGATGTGIINVTVNLSQPTGYQAVYFNNLTLSGTPVLSRDETTVDYDWGGGSPGSGVNTDNFSARWTKTTDFAAGTYTFSVTADDGVRLYVDGVLSIDRWIDQGATTYTVDKTLAAGSHTIVMEYYERGGGAVAKLNHQPLTVPPPAPGVTPGNTYKLINPNSGKALDVAGGTAADGTNVHIWTDNGGAAQKWRITRNEDGTYKLTNPGTSRALDVNGGGTADGTNVQIWTDNAGSAQKWRITQDGDGTYKLVNPQSNKALDVSGAGTTDGTNVHIWTDNNSAAQKWQITDVNGTPPPTLPTFTGSGTAAPASLTSGATVTMNATFTSTSATNSTTRIHLEIRNPSDQQVYARDFDNEDFSPGQTKTYTATWPIPQNAPAGAYTVKGGAVSADWGTWYLWLNAAASFTVAPPSGGTELLTSAWNLTGNNGASERYQSIASSALAGKTTLRITYNLHGLQALGGDASAIIFDQNGWKYVSLSGYGQNGLDDSQTVDIPLSAFGLDLNQPVGTLHTRFWFGAAFTVDITSIRVL